MEEIQGRGVEVGKMSDTTHICRKMEEMQGIGVKFEGGKQVSTVTVARTSDSIICDEYVLRILVLNA